MHTVAPAGTRANRAASPSRISGGKGGSACIMISRSRLNHFLIIVIRVVFITWPIGPSGFCVVFPFTSCYSQERDNRITIRLQCAYNLNVGSSSVGTGQRRFIHGSLRCYLYSV